MAIEDLGPIYDSEGNDITEDVLAQAKGQTQGNTPGWRRELEQKAEQGKEAIEREKAATERAEAAERKSALLEAGVDVTTELGKYFADTYKGEATAEAIKEAAGKIGLIPISQTPAVQGELAALGRIADASAGTQIPASDLPPEEQIANFSGTADQFDDWVKKFGTQIDRTNNDAVWDKPSSREITTPQGR